jgi:hypothetical protein
MEESMQGVKMSLVAFGLVLGLAACGSESEGAEETASTETTTEGAAPSGPPSVGDSCEGQVSAGSALMACNGQQLLFCSSYSDYAWQQTQECPEGTTCTVSEDQSEGSCE